MVKLAKILGETFVVKVYEHCITPDLARSTHAYMHVSHESHLDLFKSNNFQFFILALFDYRMTSLKAEWLSK